MLSFGVLLDEVTYEKTGLFCRRCSRPGVLLRPLLNYGCLLYSPRMDVGCIRAHVARAVRGVVRELWRAKPHRVRALPSAHGLGTLNGEDDMVCGIPR